jgi:hypothetical protein
LLAAFLIGSFLMGSILRADVVDPATFRDETLFSDDTSLNIVNGEKHTVWSADIMANDKEMLPNGNILVTQGPMNGPSKIMEINMATKSVVWSISSVGGMPLRFTHDADWIGVDSSGQDIYLAADTTNDRVVEFARNGNASPTPSITPSPSPTMYSPSPSPELQPEPFPTTLVIVTATIAAVAVAGILLYFMKIQKVSPAGAIESSKANVLKERATRAAF